METFKVSFRNHISNGEGILIGLLISACFPYIMYIKTSDNINVFIWIAVIMFILSAGPALIIHINYYIISRGDIFEYASETKEITIYHKGKSMTFGLDDIDHFERSMSYNLAAKRSSVLLWEMYNHSYVHLKTGQVLTITSLVVPNLNLPISEDKIVLKENIFRLARKYDIN